MIDPRPFTYQYRTPRLSNPTYRSSNMYDSLYHLRFPSKNQFILQRQSNKPKIQQFKLPQKESSRNYNNPQRYQLRNNQPKSNSTMIRQQSLDLRDKYQPQRNQKSMSIKKQINSRYDSRENTKLYPQNNGVQSHLSNYGQNLMKTPQFNRYDVYDKQQKGFNIINCQPSQLRSSLRAFPKLTQEDKLIQRGRYN